jgi:light-harvesting protein B-800-850 alpha chain
MIYGKMWTVVKPTVGIPLFLGAVAVGSFSVHLALLNNTTWVKGFLEGGQAAKASTASTAPAAPLAKK